MRGIREGGQRTTDSGEERRGERRFCASFKQHFVGVVFTLFSQNEQPMFAACCPNKSTQTSGSQDQSEGQQQRDHQLHYLQEQQWRKQGVYQPDLCSSREGASGAGQFEQH